MAEWSKAAVLKTVERKLREFESLPLRHFCIIEITPPSGRLFFVGSAKCAVEGRVPAAGCSYKTFEERKTPTPRREKQSGWSSRFSGRFNPVFSCCAVSPAAKLSRAEFFGHFSLLGCYAGIAALFSAVCPLSKKLQKENVKRVLTISEIVDRIQLNVFWTHFIFSCKGGSARWAVSVKSGSTIAFFTASR